MTDSRMFSDESRQVETKELNLHYGKDHVLKSVTFDIRRKSVAAFIGPSGCGKSSYLRCLNRMNDFIPTARVEGSILIDGTDIYAPGVDVITLRRKVGMVFQKPNPFPMSIYDNVAYGPRLFGIRTVNNWTTRCVQAWREPRCGTRSRTSSTRPALGSRADSSKGFA